MELIALHNGLTATVLDLDFCRLCLGRDGTELISVFNESINEAGKEPLNVKIFRFFEVQINENDILPTRICQLCLLQTESCSDFRDNCIRNEKKLQELIAVHDPDEVETKVELQPEVTNLKREEVVLEYDGEIEEEEEDAAETIVVDPTKDYESSNQSLQEFTDEDENTDVPPVEDTADESVKVANMNDSSEDLLEDSKLKKLVHMCKYCDVAFAMSNACYVHETQDHDLLAPYACQFCEFKTINRGILITHIRDVHGIDRPYICIQCNKGFHRRSDLKKHTFVHSGVRPFACHECGKSFSRNTNLTKHLRIHSGFRPHICNTCPRSFANKADLVRHQNIHMSLGKQFSCSKCNNTYARKDKLLSHERICYAKQLQQQQQQQIAQIMATAIPIGTTSMTQAEFDAENMVIALDPYQEIDHTQTEDDPGIPNAAPISAISTFSNITLPLNQPNTSPLQAKFFSCQKCPKKFLSKNTLHTHQLIHSDVRNYRCQTCDKKFIRKRELDRHLTAVHSNHKPFECKQCAKRFSRKDKLLRHERVHRDDKFFSCNACDAKFLRKEALTIHSKIHCTAAAAIRTDNPSSEVIIMIDQDQQDQLLMDHMLSYSAEDVAFSSVEPSALM
ncbi:gastrula zinc finger protein XlCGF57.1-like [Malaya genurostris]|uniref:gastrula zinc finger protein XlCGF57.1-like n=1 Tax=Malaya genurostris TaxID=325434 RepID=UPI0026F3AB71|nr:gastrula zinc finger protein XlCGF57.1-like [Malaya genurostris]